MIQSRLKVLISQKELRENRKWTYENIKEATGISITTIHRLARNTAKRYDANTLDALCRFLNCSVGDLLVYIPEPEHDTESMP